MTIEKQTIDRVLRLLNSGGWQLQINKTAKSSASRVTTVTRAECDGLDLLIQFGSESMSVRKLHELDIKIIDDEHPRQIIFTGSITTRESRTRQDNGGTYEVTNHPGELVFVNTTARTKPSQTAEPITREALVTEVDKATKPLDVFEPTDEHKARVSTFLAWQRAMIGSAHLTSLTGDATTLTFMFDNGHKLQVSFCKSPPCPELEVKGGDSKIGLRFGTLRSRD